MLAAIRTIVLEHHDNVVPIIAVVISGLALLASIWMRAKDRAALTAEAGKREVLEREVADLHAAQARALEGIERATRAGIDPAAAHAHGASISIFTIRGTPRKAEDRGDIYLVLKNLGPGGAMVRELEALDRPPEEVERRGVLGYPTAEVLPDGAVELLPGEEHYVRLNIYMGTAWPVIVRVRWVDGTDADKERVRTLQFPP